eukprot:CAMPEP_0113439544 /NCGR_PEP_ID=MMETSP0014_2-20120614/94_1 /TAXON_ID=2857 /ORGANISM="Nitzschia sp." /LENGTH=237 /DNA_ID=CAMNT_0000330305 /DNA_START=194 /DNA_END=907 /DNA_ORIENTATION=+ /assembly_acc=CAM_ASM_000159
MIVSRRMMMSGDENGSTLTGEEVRIFCYGDSLTAGTCSDTPFELFPYAPHLEKLLNNNDANSENYRRFVVRHRGLPGWTAKEMVRVADEPQYGLRTIINNIKDPSLSVVIILAGTNDVGYAMSSSSNDDAAKSIVSDVAALHEIVWQQGIKTIVVGIPPSGYQSMVKEAKVLVDNVNGQLRTFCEQQADRQKATFVEFPFEYQPNGENWSSDGLHFSPKGYEALARHLAQPVKDVVL